MTELTYDNHTVALEDADKVLFPDCGITKGDVVDYYAGIAPVMLPHLAGRPLTLQRFPEGIRHTGFFQQQRGDHFPPWIERLHVEHGGRTGGVDHLLCGDQAGVAFLANQDSICLHRWLSRREHLRNPDLMLIDLDPPGEHFDRVRRAALRVRDAMKMLGLTPFIMTTGSRGLHVAAPLQPETNFDRVRGFARVMARILADAYPRELTVEQRRNRRHGRVYLDVTRNTFAQTSVVPYAVRGKPGAPVAVPLQWEELEDPQLDAGTFNICNVLQRLTHIDDPWRNIHQFGAKPADVALALEEAREH